MVIIFQFNLACLKLSAYLFTTVSKIVTYITSDKCIWNPVSIKP